MKNENVLNKLNDIVSKKPSQWLKKAKWRQENREWLEKSAKIAIKILRELRAQKLSQKDLAEKIKVTPQYINKIVKGGENLSLETIGKLEKALRITLFSISEVSQDIPETNQPSVSMESEYHVLKEYNPLEEILYNKGKTSKSFKAGTYDYNSYSEYKPEEDLLAA